MKTLFWKEFRENWSIITLGIIFAGFVTYIIYSNREFAAQVNDPKIILISILFFTAFLAANLFSTEFGHKTLPFLLLLPISRTRLWAYKALIGLFFVLILTWGTIGAIIAVSHLTPNSVALISFFDIPLEDVAVYFAILFLVYSGTIFISVQVTNTISAGGGGLMFSLFSMVFWLIFSGLFYLSEKFYITFFIPIIIFTISSWMAFNQLDVLITKKRVQRGQRFCCISLLIVGIILILIQSNWDPVPLSQIKEVSTVTLLPDNNQVLCKILKNGESEYKVNRYWLISLKDGSYHKYPGKGYELFYIRNPISPDRKYLLIGDNRRFFNLVESGLFSSRLGIFDTKTFEIKKYNIKRTGIFANVDFHDWSFDSRRVLYRIWPFSYGTERFGYIDISTGEDKIINVKKPIEFVWLIYPRWAPDGKTIYLFGQEQKNKINYWAVCHIDINGKILWKHTQNDKNAFPRMSNDGTWLMFSQNTADTSNTQKLFLMNLYTLETTLIFEGYKFGGRSLSPDGKWLAISAITQLQKGRQIVKSEPITGISTTRNIYELWLVNLQTKQKTKFIPEFDAELKGWSPDSKNIAFAEYIPREKRYSNSEKEISIETKQVRDMVSWEYGDKLLPDGNYLRSKGNRLIIVSPEGKELKEVFPKYQVK